MSPADEAKPSPDDTLVERARQGDRAAFDAIVRHHLPQVWSVVWRIVRHRQDAEDIVQETFLTAFRSLPEFRGDSSLSTWLHRIAATRALNHLDRAAEKIRRASQSLDPPQHEHDPEGAAAATLAAGGPSPLRALESRELLRRLADCLEKLPAGQRAVLTLRDVDEMDYEGIAAALSLAVGTVRSRLARGRLALKECVEGSA